MYLVFALTLFGAFAESFGIVLILPLLQRLDGQEVSDPEGIQLILTRALDAVGVGNSTAAILTLITLAFLIKGALMFAAQGYRAHLRAVLLRELKGRMYDDYSRMNYGYYSSNSTGHFINVINGQINNALAAFESFTGLASQVITTIIYIALAFFVAWRFGLMALVAGAVLLHLFRRLNSYVRDVSRQASLEGGVLAKLLVQSLQSFKYLSSTGQTSKSRVHVVESLERLTDYEFKRGVVVAFVNACREPIAVVFVAAIVLIQVAFLKAPLGPILVSILLLQRGLNTTMLIQGMWLTTLGQMGSVELVRDEFKAQLANRQADGEQQLPPFTSKIEFDQVHFCYGEQSEDVLKSIDLRITANTSVAFVGPSGAGKSTMVDLLTLMLQPRTGNITIDGLSAEKLDLQSWRSQIGYVSQDTVVFDDTIANNICMWAGDPSQDDHLDAQIREAARQAYIDDFIETLPDGYETQVGDRGVRLSGGQKQRLFIARELFRQPRLLILDEATSALDSESERFIQQSIDALKGHTTVIIIAHRLSTIRNVDTVYVLEAGRIVESGPYEQLRTCKGSRFGQLVDMQAL